MNAERLKALRERADQAVKIAAEIKEVQSSNINNWSGPLMPDLRRRIIDAGCAAVIADLERQLESLLAPEPPEPVPERINDFPLPTFADLAKAERDMGLCRDHAERANGFRRAEIRAGEWSTPAVTFPPATIVDAHPQNAPLETVPLH